MRFFCRLRVHILSLLVGLTTIAPAAPLPEAKPKPQIVGVVQEMSEQKIEKCIRRLVSFDTRHTLSDTTSETRGIAAARRWLHAEFERYASDSGNRLQVTMDAFTQPPGERNPQPAQTINVVATLPRSTAVYPTPSAK